MVWYGMVSVSLWLFLFSARKQFIIVACLSCHFRFMRKHGDAELASMLETAVPPADLNAVGLFRSALAKYRKQAWGRHVLFAGDYGILCQVAENKAEADGKHGAQWG